MASSVASEEKKATNNSRNIEKNFHEDRNENDQHELPTNGCGLPKNKPRRPDKQLYVPRAKRLEQPKAPQPKDKSFSASPSIQDAGDVKNDPLTKISSPSPTTNPATNNDVEALDGVSTKSQDKKTSRTRSKQKNNTKNSTATGKSGKKLQPSRSPASKAKINEKDCSPHKLLSSSDAGGNSVSKKERSDEGGDCPTKHYSKSPEDILDNTKVNQLSSTKLEILNDDASIVGVVMQSDIHHSTHRKHRATSKTSPPNCQIHCESINSENFYNCLVENDLSLSTSTPKSDKTNFDKLTFNVSKKVGIDSTSFPGCVKDNQKCSTGYTDDHVNKQTELASSATTKLDGGFFDDSNKAAGSSEIRTHCTTSTTDNEVSKENNELLSKENSLPDFIQFPEISLIKTSNCISLLNDAPGDTVELSLSSGLNSISDSREVESESQCDKTLLDEPFVSDAEILQPVCLETTHKTIDDSQKETVSVSPSVLESNNSSASIKVDLELFESEFSNISLEKSCQVTSTQPSSFHSPYMDDLDSLHKSIDKTEIIVNSDIDRQHSDKNDKTNVNTNEITIQPSKLCTKIGSEKNKSCSDVSTDLDACPIHTHDNVTPLPLKQEPCANTSTSIFLSSELEALNAFHQNNVSSSAEAIEKCSSDSVNHLKNGESSGHDILLQGEPDNAYSLQADKTNGESIAEDSWENLYSDDGDCLDPKLVKELTKIVGKVNIKKTKIDYLSFQPKEPHIGDDEFGHVIEIYDFPVEFKTQDLMAAFSSFKNRGFDIKWVDDTHALGLFASPMAAADALTTQLPFLKTRPLVQGTRESKLKARRHAEFLQPYRPRPETSASLARRLVTGALGLKVQIPKEQREKERQKLKEAKEKKKLAAKQRNDAWEGNFSST